MAVQFSYAYKGDVMTDIRPGGPLHAQAVSATPGAGDRACTPGLTPEGKGVTLWVPRGGQEAKRSVDAQKVKFLKKLKSFGFS